MSCVEETPGVCRTESNDKRVLCTEENKPVCQNGFEPIAVEKGCLCEWKCQCKYEKNYDNALIDRTSSMIPSGEGKWGGGVLKKFAKLYNKLM